MGSLPALSTWPRYKFPLDRYFEERFGVESWVQGYVFSYRAGLGFLVEVRNAGQFLHGGSRSRRYNHDRFMMCVFILLKSALFFMFSLRTVIRNRAQSKSVRHQMVPRPLLLCLGLIRRHWEFV